MEVYWDSIKSFHNFSGIISILFSGMLRFIAISQKFIGFLTRQNLRIKHHCVLKKVDGIQMQHNRDVCTLYKWLHWKIVNYVRDAFLTLFINLTQSPLHDAPTEKWSLKLELKHASFTTCIMKSFDYCGIQNMVIQNQKTFLVWWR